MSETWILDVTDLKQYVCCPRIVYYHYCLPEIRPMTYTMQVGILAHQEEEEREARRSLKSYGIEQGEGLFHYSAVSTSLGLKGKMDLVIIVPARDSEGKEAVVVEYKHSEQKAGSHFKPRQRILDEFGL
ncbi:MAG: Dna2/Cas4 domain-containing protein [Ktedonobacteraceae bacterium]|nr:Dna2/Cas4 domain-containing protein [Ktedonobacteraceae bacterium]